MMRTALSFTEHKTSIAKIHLLRNVVTISLPPANIKLTTREPMELNSHKLNVRSIGIHHLFECRKKWAYSRTRSRLTLPFYYPSSLVPSSYLVHCANIHINTELKELLTHEEVPSLSSSMSSSQVLTGAVEEINKVRNIQFIHTAYTSFNEITPLRKFCNEFSHIRVGDKNETVRLRVAGRVISIRDMGRIYFITIRSDTTTLQIVKQVDKSCTKAELQRLCQEICIGDIIGAIGNPGRTIKGELSLYAIEVYIITPYMCTDQSVCPNLKGKHSLNDTEVRYRYRFTDMMTNAQVINNFVRRHTLLKALRSFLDNLDFVEVETPILQSVASGANAKPFVTHHNDNDAELYLRIAPELFLKQCVVGGLDRVYEIGKVFRNESADRNHNPEFTTCELYAAYHNYSDLMPLTETIFTKLAIALNNSSKLNVYNNQLKEVREIDFSAPFARIYVYDEIKRIAGVELPHPLELNTPKGIAYMSAIMLRHSIPFPPVRTAAKMFDKLIEHFLTNNIIEPTFVIGHPTFMSPLAKECDDKSGIAERFEVFINGVEYCNAYSELNDPREQHLRFQQQMIERVTGDEEAMPLDEIFLKALQVGLPPTAGWGLGIDRLVTLLNGEVNIRESIIFPLLRDDTMSRDAKRRRRMASFFAFSKQMTLLCLNTLESEMIKRDAPRASQEKVRELRECVNKLDKHHCAFLDSNHLTTVAESKSRYDFTMSLIRLLCGW